MTSPSTAATIAVLGAGGLTAITLFLMAKRWEAQKEAPLGELLAVLGGYGVIAAIAWHSLPEKPGAVHLLSAAVRGASRGSL